MRRGRRSNRLLAIGGGERFEDELHRRSDRKEQLYVVDGRDPNSFTSCWLIQIPSDVCLQKIRAKVRDRRYEFAVPHFFEEMANDDLVLADIEMAVSGGRIRKRFNRGAYGARYEIIGPSTDGRQIAVICKIKQTGKLLFITTYTLE